MFDLTLAICFTGRATWKNIKTYSRKISKNHAIEANCYQTNQIVAMSASVRTTGNHPGIYLSVGVFGFTLEVEAYNINHENINNG